MREHDWDYKGGIAATLLGGWAEDAQRRGRDVMDIRAPWAKKADDQYGFEKRMRVKIARLRAEARRGDGGTKA